MAVSDVCIRVHQLSHIKYHDEILIYSRIFCVCKFSAFHKFHKAIAQYAAFFSGTNNSAINQLKVFRNIIMSFLSKAVMATAEAVRNLQSLLVMIFSRLCKWQAERIYETRTPQYMRHLFSLIFWLTVDFINI